MVVLADSEENNGLLQDTFPFSYSIRSPELLNPEGTQLGDIIAEEAFNPHPVTNLEFWIK